MPFCFQSFSCFENQWVRDMSISSVENGCSNLAGITNQQSGSRVQPVSHSQNSISPLLWQAGRLGSKLLLSSGVMRKTFLSASVRAPLRELSAQPGNCNPSVTASQMWDFVSLKMGFSSLCWTHRLLVLEKDLAPIDSSILHCPHNRSTARAQLHAPPETHNYTFCSSQASSVCLGLYVFFPWNHFPCLCCQ